MEQEGRGYGVSEAGGSLSSDKEKSKWNRIKGV